MQDLRLYISFLLSYTKSRLMKWGQKFESIKDVIVAFLIVKRGKYSNSFLNITFFLLAATVVIGGPTIAENNPFLSSLDNSEASQTAIVSYNPTENSLATIESPKPRDRVEEHKVREGETLASIAEKFNVSVDSIKWANGNMKSTTIKVGQVLKIPPVTGVVHKVSSGENIYTIAKKYKTDPQKIVNFPFNDFSDLETFALTPGQTLIIPDGVIEEVQPKAPSRQFFAQIQAGVKGSSNFIWPTSGVITQYPVWYHMALDIANPSAPAVIAADTGTVIYAACISYGYGCHVIIDHGNGYQSLYGHLSVIGVSAGQAVGQGNRIGTMGSTGRSTGTHLHFEIRSGGTLLNPLNFLK